MFKGDGSRFSGLRARLTTLSPHPETWHGMGRALNYGGWAILAVLLAGVAGIWLLSGLMARMQPLFRFGLLLTLVGTLLTVLGFARGTGCRANGPVSR